MNIVYSSHIRLLILSCTFRGPVMIDTVCQPEKFRNLLKGLSREPGSVLRDSVSTPSAVGVGNGLHTN